MRNQPGIVPVKEANIVEVNRQTDEWRQDGSNEGRRGKRRRVALVGAKTLV